MVDSTSFTHRCFTVLLSLSVMAIGALGLWAPPPEAHACSCVAPRLKRDVLPSNGARGVSTDTQLRVFLTGGFPHGLRVHLAKEYRLKDGRGKLVKLKSHVVGARLDLIPGKPLQPNQTHTLEQLVAYDDQGTRMTDTQRWRTALRAGHAPTIKKKKVRLAWFAVSSFTTGKTKGPGKVAKPRLVSAGLSFRYGGGDCGPGVLLEMKFRHPKRQPGEVLELDVLGQGIVATFRPQPVRRGLSSVYVSDMLCNPDKVYLKYRGRLSARLAIRSISGRRSKWTPWMQAKGRFGRGFTLRSWSKNRARARRWRKKYAKHHAAAVGRWASAALVKKPKPVLSGPAGCPYGFRPIRRGQVAGSGAPWMYNELSTLGWTGKRGWLVMGRGDKKRPRLVSFDAKLKAKAVVLPHHGGSP